MSFIHACNLLHCPCPAARVDVAVICCQSEDDVTCCQSEDDVICCQSEDDVVCCQGEGDVICCQSDSDVIVFDSGMGDLRFWDPRFTESVRVHHTNTRGFTAVDVHPRADVIAWYAVCSCICTCMLLSLFLFLFRCSQWVRWTSC